MIELLIGLLLIISLPCLVFGLVGGVVEKLVDKEIERRMRDE